MARTFDTQALIAGTRGAQARLEAALAKIEASTAAPGDPSGSLLCSPSILPGWTRAHVLTHLARNAEAGTRMLEAALNGRVAEQYPGGTTARTAEIEAGTGRPAAEIVEDVRATAKVLDDMLDLMTPQAWQQPVRFLAIGEQPAARVVWSRWREVEIHHSDLDIGYRAADWPAEFLAEYLDGELRRLPSRLPAGLSVELRVEGHEGVYGPGEAKPLILRGERWAVYAWLVGRTSLAREGLRGEYGGEPSDLIQLPAWA